VSGKGLRSGTEYLSNGHTLLDSGMYCPYTRVTGCEGSHLRYHPIMKNLNKPTMMDQTLLN